MDIALSIALGLLIVLNIYASYRCYRDVLSTARQRLFQMLFVWFVPFVGAALSLRVLLGGTEKSDGKYLSESSPADEFVTGSGRLNRQGYISSPDDNFHSASDGDAAPD